MMMSVEGASGPGEPGWPDLMAILSSPVSMVMWEMVTWLDEKGSMPSVLGERAGARILPLRMTTSSE